MTVVAVADAGPLIHLAEIDSIDLLSAFAPLLIPKAVYAEIESGGLPDGVPDLSFELVESDTLSIESDELDAGELAALAVARDRSAVLLTDDLAAREAASDAGVEVHGSIGVIAFGYGSGVLDRDEAASRMRALQRRTSLFVTDEVVERGIRMLDEQ